MTTDDTTRREPGPERRPSALRRPLSILAVVALALVAMAVGGFYVLAGSNGSDDPLRAVIVDQLSLTAPNPAFTEEATAMLESAGYVVDYIAGEDVTVEVYRDLPSHGYDFVFVRAHAGRRVTDDGTLTEYAHLFTAESYSTVKYIDEQLAGRLNVVGYDLASINAGEKLFGIPDTFVSDSMVGDFDDATVVLMGCDILRAERMAEAFVGRGAGSVVGWDQQVSAPHTDAATLSMLRHILEDGMSTEDAVAAAMDELGPDPFYNGEMVAYLD